MTEHAEKEIQQIKADTSISSRRPRWAPILVVVALATAAIVAVPSVREPVLRAAGWALVINEPISPADIIVVSSFAGGAGAREAADLVQSGIATRVAVFSDPQEVHEFIRRGLPDRAARQIRQLKSLGVTDVVQIPTTEVGTSVHHSSSSSIALALGRIAPSIVEIGSFPSIGCVFISTCPCEWLA
jgi:hypothetical protein